MPCGLFDDHLTTTTSGRGWTEVFDLDGRVPILSQLGSSWTVADTRQTFRKQQVTGSNPVVGFNLYRAL